MKNHQPLTPDKAYERLASLCSKREICRYDAYQRLWRWGVEQECHDAIVGQLVLDGFINDMRFARTFIEEKTHINGWGRRKVEQELKRRNIDTMETNSFFDEIDESETLEQLKRLLENKRPTIRASSDYERNQKLIRYALSRGYLWKDIQRCMPKGAEYDNPSEE